MFISAVLVLHQSVEGGYAAKDQGVLFSASDGGRRWEGGGEARYGVVTIEIGC